MTRRSHGLADRPGEPYPATFRIHRVESRGIEPRPVTERHSRNAIAVSSRWTMTPSVERRGIEPRLPGCKPSVFPLDQRPDCSQEVRPGIEPGLPPYQSGVPPKHLQTIRIK